MIFCSQIRRWPKLEKAWKRTLMKNCKTFILTKALQEQPKNILIMKRLIMKLAQSLLMGLIGLQKKRSQWSQRKDADMVQITAIRITNSVAGWMYMYHQLILLSLSLVLTIYFSLISLFHIFFSKNMSIIMFESLRNVDTCQLFSSFIVQQLHLYEVYYGLLCVKDLHNLSTSVLFWMDSCGRALKWYLA